MTRNKLLYKKYTAIQAKYQAIMEKNPDRKNAINLLVVEFFLSPRSIRKVLDFKIPVQVETDPTQLKIFT